VAPSKVQTLMRRVDALTYKRKIKFQSDPNAQGKISIQLWSKNNIIIRAVDAYIGKKDDIFQRLTDLITKLEGKYFSSQQWQIVHQKPMNI